MTALQITILHTAMSQLRKLRPAVYDDAWYRNVLRNIGRVAGDRPSSKSLTQAGFEDVMAFLESHGFRDARQHASYWRDVSNRRIGYASTRQVHAIRELAAQQQYDLRRLCLRLSDGAADCPQRLSPSQAYQLTEMLKSVIARKRETPAGGDEGGASPGIAAGVSPAFTAPTHPPASKISTTQEVPLIQPTKDQLYESLMNSTVCPACGAYKKEHRSLCYDCFCRLPPPLKERLYRRFGQGYEEAMAEALRFLGVEAFQT